MSARISRALQQDSVPRSNIWTRRTQCDHRGCTPSTPYKAHDLAPRAPREARGREALRQRGWADRQRSHTLATRAHVALLPHHHRVALLRQRPLRCHHRQGRRAVRPQGCHDELHQPLLRRATLQCPRPTRLQPRRQRCFKSFRRTRPVQQFPRASAVRDRRLRPLSVCDVAMATAALAIPAARQRPKSLAETERCSGP